MDQIIKLPNGLRIVMAPMKGRTSAAVGVWVGVGGRFESKKLSGISHFIEHLTFKGTRRFNNRQLKEMIEGRGGLLNAFTDEESTCYYAKMLGSDITYALEVLSELCANPLFLKADFEQERNVIVEEIRMYKDLPMHCAMDMLNEVVWPNHALGRILTGTEEGVMKMKRSDLVLFHKRHYFAERIVVAAAGDFKPDLFLRACKDNLGHLKRGKTIKPAPPKKTKKGPHVKFFAKKIAQGHICLGIPAFNRTHPDRYILDVINVLLGGNMSSRLFQSIREDKGLAYEIKSAYSKMMDTGLFTIYAGVDKKNIYKTIRYIVKELQKISQDLVKPNELERAKQYCIGSLKLYMEGTVNKMMWVGEGVLSLDQIRDWREIISRIKSVTRQDVRRVGACLMRKDRLHLSVVADKLDEEKLTKELEM